ncbi:hypothetical protein ACM6PT_36090, partial [Klebsiella pneumoniae]
LKPGASASEEELLEHASRHVPERAAVPKDIWLIESMPVTAVGKTFKPALRLDAIRRVLEEESRRIAEDIRVEVVADERLVETVGAFAARLASGPTFAFAQTKRLLRDGA